MAEPKIVKKPGRTGGGDWQKPIDKREARTEELVLSQVEGEGAQDFYDRAARAASRMSSDAISSAAEDGRLINTSVAINFTTPGEARLTLRVVDR